MVKRIHRLIEDTLRDPFASRETDPTAQMGITNPLIYLELACETLDEVRIHPSPQCQSESEHR
jgi:hypothetical protein